MVGIDQPKTRRWIKLSDAETADPAAVIDAPNRRQWRLSAES